MGEDTLSRVSEGPWPGWTKREFIAPDIQVHDVSYVGPNGERIFRSGRGWAEGYRTRPSSRPWAASKGDGLLRTKNGAIRVFQTEHAAFEAHPGHFGCRTQL